MPAPMRVLCFPHAGGSSHAYVALCRSLAPWHDLVVIDLPGRAVRMREPLLDNFSKACARLADDVEQAADGGPFTLLGHGLGGLLAFGVARKLLAEKRAVPLAILLSASCPPGVENTWDSRGIDELEECALHQELANYGWTPAELLRDEDLLCYLRTLLRADRRVLQTADFGPGPHLIDIPCALFVPSADPGAPPQAMVRWSEHCLQPPLVYRVEGGHLGLFEQAVHSAHLIRLAIADLMDERGLSPHFLGRPLTSV